MNFILFSLKQTIPKLRWGKFRVKERWEEDETDFFFTMRWGIKERRMKIFQFNLATMLRWILKLLRLIIRQILWFVAPEKSPEIFQSSLRQRSNLKIKKKKKKNEVIQKQKAITIIFVLWQKGGVSVCLCVCVWVDELSICT